MKEENLPIPVQNLRRIWAKYKEENKITQAEAAEKLGWKQSNFSHYIANINKLNPNTIFKLSVFLQVDPTEIDPTCFDDLPDTRFVRAETTSGTKTTEQLCVSGKALTGNTYAYHPDMGYKLPMGCKIVAVTPNQAKAKQSNLFLVRKSAKDQWKLLEHESLPDLRKRYKNVKSVTNIYT
jgi:transcriptional regulator with XRE-family HTH domain